MKYEGRDDEFSEFLDRFLTEFREHNPPVSVLGRASANSVSRTLAFHRPDCPILEKKMKRPEDLDQPSTSSFIQLKGFQMPDSDQIKTGLRGVQIDHGDDESVRYHSRIHALNGEF